MLFPVTEHSMKGYKTILLLVALVTYGVGAYAQGVRLGEVVLISTSPLKKDVDPASFQSFMVEELIPAWNDGSSGTTLYLLKADRGDRKGEFLNVCVAAKPQDRKELLAGSPFTDKAVSSVAGPLTNRMANFLSEPEAYTEYQLIGADQFTSLPVVDLLGIHYIKVKPERAKDFEKLVREKLHPTVGNLVHDMNLLYYKGVAGESKGTFITIFAITSVSARERFWPTGGNEQEVVKQLFGPHKELAGELGNYLVEDSFLAPESGGAAAFFESREWTDYVVIDSN